MRIILGGLALLAVSGIMSAQQHVETDVLTTAPLAWTSEAPVTLPFAVPAAGAQMRVNDFNVEYVAAELNGKVVKGAPYSAEEVTQTSQTLADGNRITRKTSAMVYRDGQGRTRREQSLGAVAPMAAGAAESGQTVMINDPVAGVNFVLAPASRTARKLPGLDVVTHSAGDAPANQQFFEKRVVIAHGSADAANVSTAGVRVMVFNSESGEAKKESLGTQTIEGVQAEGTRITATIPAGQIGNEQPIQTVSESWYSPQLQTVVMSKQTDPRMGETTFRLTNINLGEPPASLFQLPADYKVIEAKPVVLHKEVETVTK